MSVPKVEAICSRYDNDKTRMLDILRDVQAALGCISEESASAIAACCSTFPVEVRSVATFYSFLSETPQGKIIIRLCNDVIDRMAGADAVAEVLSQELGIEFGQTTADGLFTLEHTPCIGMSDQAPAALVNDVVVTKLTPESARTMVQQLRSHQSPEKLVEQVGDGNNADPLVQSMVNNNILLKGDVLFTDMQAGAAIDKALSQEPADIVGEVKNARLRGRGGAGFPTGMKWDFARATQAERRFVICNADEGEPGTFKDRVLLTEHANDLFEGMTLAAYAIGSSEGILYLRGEYAYLQKYLESVLEQRRKAGLLGAGIRGKDGFDFDIRIQMGAGAYICGEETALISSCEGTAGDPKDRPPFPVQKGYLGYPTIVNNVETFCAVTRIVLKGADWFSKIGTQNSSGTKLLSVCGDCAKPGVYEVAYGMTLNELLELVGASDTLAVQVGGPSGQMIGANEFGRKFEIDDLATGGSVMIFNKERDLLDVVKQFMKFFVDESCGYCVPCRVGNVLLLERLDAIIEGRGEPGDLEQLQELGKSIRFSSRCGLGQTSPNPIITTLKNFRALYDDKVQENPNGFRSSFDLSHAVKEAEGIAGRPSTHL